MVIFFIFFFLFDLIKYKNKYGCNPHIFVVSSGLLRCNYLIMTVIFDCYFYFLLVRHLFITFTIDAVKNLGVHMSDFRL